MKKFEMPELQVIVFEEEPVMASGLSIGTAQDAQAGINGDFSANTPGQFL